MIRNKVITAARPSNKRNVLASLREDVLKVVKDNFYYAKSRNNLIISLLLF